MRVNLWRGVTRSCTGGGILPSVLPAVFRVSELLSYETEAAVRGLARDGVNSAGDVQSCCVFRDGGVTVSFVQRRR